MAAVNQKEHSKKIDIKNKLQPIPVNSLVYSFVPAFHCSTRYHGKTDLILVISWSWEGNVFLSVRVEIRLENKKGP